MTLSAHLQSLKRPLLIIATYCAIGQFAFMALASEHHKVVQKGRAFSVAQIDIATGDSVVFSNEDEFIHQIYVDSKSMNFDSAEQPPGEVIELPFPAAGQYDVRCHIHPKMHLVVNVH